MLIDRASDFLPRKLFTALKETVEPITEKKRQKTRYNCSMSSVTFCVSHHILLGCLSGRDLAGLDTEHARKREEVQTDILTIKLVKNIYFKTK